MAKSPPKTSNSPKQQETAQAVGNIFQQQPSPPNIQFAATAQVTQGPYPPPDVLAGYERVLPGAAERILKLAETEAANRNRREDEALQANIRAQDKQLEIAEMQTKTVARSDLCGQIAGLVVCVLCIAGSVYLGLKGHDWLAAFLAGIPTAAVIKAFAIHRQQQAAQSQ